MAGERGTSSPRRAAPHEVRLPGFVADEAVGLGDVITRATTAVGIRPCGGCAQRARQLSSWLVFRGRQ